MADERQRGGGTAVNAEVGSVDTTAAGRKYAIGWGTLTMEGFKRLEKIGEGTYGEVFKAVHLASGEIVALKKIRVHNSQEGFPRTAVREVKILKSLRHPHMVNLKGVISSIPAPGKAGSVSFVFEYVDYDMTGLINSGVKLSHEEIRCYMKQLLSVLDYLHSKGFIHRDIKCSNLLLRDDHCLKLADFGLSRAVDDRHPKRSNKVITLWYRPPELLLGEECYGPAVDMWSVGCILAELYIGKPLFQGSTELTQLDLIFDICGTPQRDDWPEHTSLPLWDVAKPPPPRKSKLRDHLLKLCPSIPDGALDLLRRLLMLNPRKRLSAKLAANMRYFTRAPVDRHKLRPLHKVLSPGVDYHEFQSKIRRRAEKQASRREASRKLRVAPKAQPARAPAPAPRRGPPPRGSPPALPASSWQQQHQQLQARSVSGSLPRGRPHSGAPGFRPAYAATGYAPGAGSGAGAGAGGGRGPIGHRNTSVPAYSGGRVGAGAAAGVSGAPPRGVGQQAGVTNGGGYGRIEAGSHYVPPRGPRGTPRGVPAARAPTTHRWGAQAQPAVPPSTGYKRDYYSARGPGGPPRGGYRQPMSYSSDGGAARRPEFRGGR